MTSQTAVWHPFTPMQSFLEDDVPVICAGEGFELIDTEGKRYVDGISSLWCNVFGHRVPAIDQAIKAQIDRISHTTLLGLQSHISRELAERLVEVTPQGLNHVFYSDAGATAVEAALKIAVQYHAQKTSPAQSRHLFVRLGDSYHGDTLGAVSLGRIEAFHHVYAPLLFQTLTIPSPGASRLPPGMTQAEYARYCLDQLTNTLAEHADQIAAVIIEPLVQGAAGILVHPPGYLRAVRELTARHGILMIADEVAVGFGKTGTLFACEQEHVCPDLLCLAKGITGGYLPLAATLATSEIYDAFLGPPAEMKTFFHGHTYTGNPLACAAALATLDLFAQAGTLENVHANATMLAEGLQQLHDHPHVRQVRQKGIMTGIELVRDRAQDLPFAAQLRIGHRVIRVAREKGLIIRPLGDTIVLMPAIAMDQKTLERVLSITLESIDEALAEC